MNDEQEKMLKQLSVYYERKKITEENLRYLVKKLLILQKRCLAMGIRIKDIDKVADIVDNNYRRQMSLNPRKEATR